MDIDALTNQYRAKTDEELLQLAAESEHLTPEAWSTLKGELAKRRIEVLPNNFAPRNEGEVNVPRQALGSVEPIGEFVPAVLKFYHRHRWLLVKLTAPAVVVGTVALIFSRYEQRQIARQAMGDWLVHRPRVFLEATLVGLTANLITWFAFCFSFAIICAAVEQMRLTVQRQIRKAQQTLDLFLARTVEHRCSHRHTVRQVLRKVTDLDIGQRIFFPVDRVYDSARDHVRIKVQMLRGEAFSELRSDGVADPFFQILEWRRFFLQSRYSPVCWRWLSSGQRIVCIVIQQASFAGW